MRNINPFLLCAAALSLPCLAAATAHADEPPPAAIPPAATASAAPPAATATASAVKPKKPRTHSHESNEPPSAFNPTANKVVWDDRWARFRTAEYVVTGL